MPNTGISQTFKNVETELADAFEKIKIKYGYTLSVEKRSYDINGNLTLKIEAVKEGELSRDADEYTRNHIRLGLPPLDALFVSGGVTYRITGLNKTSTKVKAKAPNGKGWLFPIDFVQLYWKANKG